jgi:hypothetical protein
MGAGGAGQPTEEHIEGVRVPCWDARRRVWQAIELLERERRMGSPRPKQTTDHKEHKREAATGR